MAEARNESRHELHLDLALLMATSGSTGSPRLVRLSRACLEANAAAIADYLDIEPTDRAVTTLPLHYCYGLSVVHSNLLSGAAVVLTDASVTYLGFWELVRQHRVTSLHGVPHTFALLDRVGAELDVGEAEVLDEVGVVHRHQLLPLLETLRGVTAIAHHLLDEQVGVAQARGRVLHERQLR